MELTAEELALRAQIYDAILVALLFGVVAFLWFWLGQVERDGGPTRLERWRAARAARREQQRSVNHSSAGGPAYVAEGGRSAPARSSFPASAPTETENDAEAETAETDPEKVIVSREKLDTLLAQARARGQLEGGATVLGALLGGGYLDAVKAGEQVTAAKQFAFKYLSAERKPPSGRALTHVINPISKQIEAEAARERQPAPQELRTIGINQGGERQEVIA